MHAVVMREAGRAAECALTASPGESAGSRVWVRCLHVHTGHCSSHNNRKTNFKMYFGFAKTEGNTNYCFDDLVNRMRGTHNIESLCSRRFYI